ncbi:glycosyltransferase family 90 protein [Tortispora caseinolytica NRRL Y-17796]|uniref:Glycosyltransferase family 90 protein n=1 Tax=Tortispora caseinolytica NRRL Y-17796 TaxID=767744 RepID=A0A1E4T9W2_9ASCO|nr:glycosyltransferase family 90 protein [Tortispora caseinolytica NRRL Y-17796]
MWDVSRIIRKLRTDRKRQLYLGLGVVVVCLVLLKSSAYASISPKLEDTRAQPAFNANTAEEFDKHIAQIIGGDVSLPDPVEQLYLDAYLHQQPQYRRYTLRDYVRKYQQEHKRAPPPGFDVWFEYALSHGCVDFDHFDRIYEDLKPFWGMPAAKIRAGINGLKDLPDFHLITIRDGEATSTSEGYRITDVKRIINDLAPHLPNMDIIINSRDEPRIMVPYKLRRKLENIADEQALSASHKVTLNTYSHSIVASDFPEKEEYTILDLTSLDTFSHAHISCPGDSFLKQWLDEDIDPSKIEALYKENGLVKNMTIANDLCTVGPLLRDKHGFLSSPSYFQKIEKLAPAFSTSKTSLNNDILLPGDKYRLGQGSYGYNEKHDLDWNHKMDEIVWRGVLTGGFLQKSNFRTLHRLRMIDTFNATYTDRIPDTVFCERTNAAGNKVYEECEVDLTEYLKEHSNIGLTSIHLPGGEMLEPYYDVLEGIPSEDQFKRKYLIDVDGHAHSARFKSFLESKSLPFKATIFREWHDSRLIPWLHYVPLDVGIADAKKLVTYFSGLEGVIEPHQGLAERIALNGRKHAEMVLRNEDIDVYILLLLLEFARLLDDNRDQIGFTMDN